MIFYFLFQYISPWKCIILQNVPYQRLGNVSLSFAFKSVLSHQLLTDFAISSQRRQMRFISDKSRLTSGDSEGNDRRLHVKPSLC